jgi:hypothetical protein
VKSGTDLTGSDTSSLPPICSTYYHRGVFWFGILKGAKRHPVFIAMGEIGVVRTPSEEAPGSGMGVIVASQFILCEPDPENRQARSQWSHPRWKLQEFVVCNLSYPSFLLL